MLTISGRSYRLKEREYSPWIQLTWRPAPGVKVHGIARFYVTKMTPDFGLYVTPINIDPGDPALPISWPTYYSVYLSKIIGEFATLGLAEDTWALNERVIDEEAFFRQTMDHHEEREKMFFNALKKSREGVVACVFDGTDRAQHMFFRYLEADHPGQPRQGHRAVQARYPRRVPARGRDRGPRACRPGPRGPGDGGLGPRLPVVPPRRKPQHLAARPGIPAPEG